MQDKAVLVMSAKSDDVKSDQAIYLFWQLFREDVIFAHIQELWDALEHLVLGTLHGRVW